MKMLHFLRFLNDTLCIGIDGTSDADLEAALGRDLHPGTHRTWLRNPLNGGTVDVPWPPLRTGGHRSMDHPQDETHRERLELGGLVYTIYTSKLLKCTSCMSMHIHVYISIYIYTHYMNISVNITKLC